MNKTCRCVRASKNASVMRRTKSRRSCTHWAVVSSITTATLFHINAGNSRVTVLTGISPTGFLAVVRKRTGRPVVRHTFAAREHFHAVHAKIVRVRDLILWYKGTGDVRQRMRWRRVHGWVGELGGACMTRTSSDPGEGRDVRNGDAAPLGWPECWCFLFCCCCCLRLAALYLPLIIVCGRVGLVQETMDGHGACEMSPRRVPTYQFRRIVSRERVAIVQALCERARTRAAKCHVSP